MQMILRDYGAWNSKPPKGAVPIAQLELSITKFEVHLRCLDIWELRLVGQTNPVLVHGFTFGRVNLLWEKLQRVEPIKELYLRKLGWKGILLGSDQFDTAS
jgi:hypothetical protein